MFIERKKRLNIFGGDLLARPATMPGGLRSPEGVTELVDMQRNEFLMVEGLHR